ncbi:hemopexin repeat-containing protein [Actinocorallia longicatena]|uniref:Hemopexin n=1 Tax=Actinocorallia longicatena TaxID=111803 RepID=A0ABP6QL84_9ACTN
MLMDGSSPDYAQLFGELRFPEKDDARSVYSPAAYLVELIGLLEGTFDTPELLERRPDLKRIVLDAENTFTETAYLDIVNEVLEHLLAPRPYTDLLERLHPFGLPFSLHSERLRIGLGELKVSPEELYRLFAAHVDHDLAAREYLALTAEDVSVITTEAGADDQLKKRYGLTGETLDVLHGTARFVEATGLSDAEVRELVELGGATLNADETRLLGPGGTGSPATAWFERAHRLIRLARRTRLTLTEISDVLTTLAGNRLDAAGLRTVAAVVRLVRLNVLTVADVLGLVLPWEPEEDVEVEVAAGDILTPANRDYRFRLAHLIDLAESEIVEIVTRYRERYAAREPSPFDRGEVGLPEISLIRRAGLLARSLGLSAGELFDVLVALEGDPALQRHTTFVVLGEGPQTQDLHKVLEAGPAGASLWLAQTLFAVAGWMRTAGFDGAELASVLGGRPEPEGTELAELFAHLQEELEPTAFEPAALVSDRFGDRAALAVHDVLMAYDDGVVAAEGSRLLDLDPAVLEKAAYQAVTDLGVVFPSDFTGLGLGDRFKEKIFRNLVYRGYLLADGTLAVPNADELELAGDFTDYTEILFKGIGATINGVAAFYPSDLEKYGELGADLRTELYDNLVFNGYLDDDGQITDPDFFYDPENIASFTVNVDLADATENVAELIEDRLDAFAYGALAVDLEAFAPLRLTDAQLSRLVESLRFNGHLDADDDFADKTALAALTEADFGLAAEFTVLRGQILAALQTRIAAFRAELTTFAADDFADLADELAARRVHAALDGVHLEDGRVIDEAGFADPEAAIDLGSGFDDTEHNLVFDRIVEVIADQDPYRLSPSALTGLDFTEEESDALFAHLVETGRITGRLVVAAPWLTYFGNADNSLDFDLPGMEDYARDVFFLLHDAAGEVAAAVTEVFDRVTGLAARQQEVLATCLADVLGLTAEVASAIAECAAGGAREARVLLAQPALDLEGPPDDPRLRLGHRRIRRFALLAAKLGLDATEVRAVFHDQDLVGKFPEPLALPPGLTRIEALLDSGDGTIYLFGDGGYWTYSGTTYALTSPARKPLTDLSAKFGPLTGIDAAFVHPSGVEWLIGHDYYDTLWTFTREPGGTRWAAKTQTWGKIRNNLADPAKIDSAFVDGDGRTYLFAGDQYIRYSGGYGTADEGYPRDVTEWWEREGLEVPAATEPVDACFTDPDGVVHMFSGDQWLTPGAQGPAAATWGVVRPTFTGLKALDAAYTTASAVHLTSGGERLRYSDSVENAGVLADEGVPRRFSGVPPQFETGVEAAFTDASGIVHLFRDGKTVALDGSPEITETAARWGVLRPPLTEGAVDAAFAGLDGKTYLFSGTTYLRYSTADYTTADSGYPRAIDQDWGGLTQVDASFVMDGRTYLFGLGGLLFDLLPDQQQDLEAARVTPALRNRFQEHGLTLAKISGTAPHWTLTTGEGITLTVRREGLRLKVFGDGSRFYVRYSDRDYRVPDEGFPKPLSDNWWNMPDGMRLGPVDAVFTGRDNHTYLFAGERFVRFDARHRWWSEPMSLREQWDSLPFTQVDAAFVGVDGRTYLFSGTSYVRYSTDDYTQVDDRYPASVSGLWGRVSNNLARTGKVDAALVLEVVEKVDGVDTAFTRTYLFSGDQYVRYTGSGLDVVDAGYPRRIATLASEPGLTGLPVTLDGVDAAFSDRRTAYLVRGGLVHAVSSVPARKYDDIPVAGVSCAFIEDGAIMAERRGFTSEEGPGGGSGTWSHLSALEGRAVTEMEFRPRVLRDVPARFTYDLDSVLFGADGNSYLFKGGSCYNVGLRRDYPLAEEWGRPRNSIYETGAVDAALVGRDGRTYLFSDDQFVVYPDPAAVADASAAVEGDPLPIEEHWAGLTSVGLAYVKDGRTHLFSKPDDDGRITHVVYSGRGHAVPDEGYPVTTTLDHFGAPEGFPFPDAVLVEGDTLILLAGEECVSVDERRGQWSIVRPIERLYPGFGHDLDAPDALRSAFRDSAGVLTFFFDDTYAVFADDAVGPLLPVRDRWGISRNPFVVPGAVIDAAFVWRGEHTYLFSGDRYVRYTGPSYRAIDPGYPKPIAANLRKEPPFAKLPETFDDALTGRIEAVIGNDRTIHLLVSGSVHTVSPEPAASFSLRSLGGIRNTLAATGKVDASIVAGERIYLFSGDQYFRYSTYDRTYVDDGYPRAISELPGEPDLARLPALPPAFQDGLDAAFRAPGGQVYLFKGREFLSTGAPQPITSLWGKVRNAFGSGALGAVFAAPTGELYAFAGDQYVRYAPGSTLEYADEGYPRTVRDDWGDLPEAFEEEGPDGAFVLDGRTYLLKRDQYVRYSGPYNRVDRTFPQEFRHRWSGTADYRLTDVHATVRFAGLCRSHPGGLASFFVNGAEDPYSTLADLFGWELDEVRWARRNLGLLRPGTREEFLFEIEFLLALVDLFAIADRAGTRPSELHGKVWAKLFVQDPALEPGFVPDLDAAAGAVEWFLERRTGAVQWPLLRTKIHNELNTRKRDALVAALVPLHGSSRDLYEQYLIDVDMGPAGTTSRVREAIAATQLYVQRYLLDLETPALPAGVDPDAVKDRLRTWWTWMRAYRTWEANRKVFLYPENYLRPELRTRKTPAFSALEDDLLQGEITVENVQAAYKRYLDEYTEVSRLAIAGGYVYPPDGAPEGLRRLVLFGRTRTEPRRYYYRTAEFRDGQKLSATWDPWLKVDTQISAERVDPVHAFGRVFVFWPVVDVVPQQDPSKTAITTTTSGSTQNITAPAPRYQVKICYSFLNLNGEWMPAQVLAADTERAGPVTDIRLYVQASRVVPGSAGDAHDAIVVHSTYKAAGTEITTAFTLTPELYGLPAVTGTTVTPPKEADLTRIFAEPPHTPITKAQIVPFNAPADSQDGPWFSIDHKGGSFLCRPAAAPTAAAELQALRGNTDPRLPTNWDRIDASFRHLDGTLYFFESNAATTKIGKFITISGGKAASRRTTGEVFGTIGTGLLKGGTVDAALVRDKKLLLFSGEDYYRYGVTAAGLTLDDGYPKKILTNTESPALPQWSKIDWAGSASGIEIFYSKAQTGIAVTGSLGTIRQTRDWRLPETGFERLHVSGNKIFAIGGGFFVKLKADFTGDGAPARLVPNSDEVPDQGPPGPVVKVDSITIAFDNVRGTYTMKGGGADEANRKIRDLGRVSTELTRTGNVTAAFVRGPANARKLYLVGPQEYVRYSLTQGQPVPDYVDDGYPKKTGSAITATFVRNEQRYVFTASGYAVLPADAEPDAVLTFLPYQGNWRALPPVLPGELTGALEDEGRLVFFFSGTSGGRYAEYAEAEAVPRPYEITALPSEIIRLTTSTAYELNRRLLVGGVDALLDPSTQELDELPGFAVATPETVTSGPTTIAVQKSTAVPVSSHLDFDSSNGLYYWEIFFHAPLLIAQALNGAQRFSDARRWYEYVFDPTQRIRYWRFLPFLAVDVAALVTASRRDLADLGAPPVADLLVPILDRVEPMVPAFRRARDLTADELTYLKGLAEGGLPNGGLDGVRAALAARPQDARTAALGERVAMLGRLRRQYDLMGDRRALIQAYLDDPFDPHTIAELRPEAYRRAVVMATIDNLLDWGDLLFRQYTAETVDEARMLYIFAYDLLGKRPVTLGPAALPDAAPYELDPGEGPGETGHLTADGTLLEKAGEAHAGVANPYFYVPGNEVFLEYWNRVEDRLSKIRASLDIMGISRPLPLFDPPADVMALVRGAAAGLTADQVVAAAAGPAPVHRFDVVFQRARELTDRLRQLGGDLLSAIDSRDDEQLAMLRNRQDYEIHSMGRQIKETQVAVAETQLAEMKASLAGAQHRVEHFTRLLAEGLSPLQEAQLAMMSIGAAGHMVAGGLKIGAAIASGAPQAHLGPFIMGTSMGGDQIGDALNIGADVSSTLAEGFSMLGEVLGVRADQQRQEQDWTLELATGRNDLIQIGHQIHSAELQLAVARRELEIHDRETSNAKAVTEFLTSKFAGPELYGWMVGQISGLYFQTYQLAFDTARAAERAFEADRGSAPGIVKATYWDSRRKGLLAGDQLALDLDRLGHAYSGADARGLEITKRVSLLELDGLALLAFKNEGRCEFALTETLFDRDFPGHYQRRVKTVSVAFLTADGQETVNATLTQLEGKTVQEPDPKAVRYLLDPKGSPPGSLRVEWRAGQTIALSEVADGTENSGLFELRYDDQRYLPFEGSGAISRWRLSARRVPAGIVDVVLTVKYTAEDGGDTFATAVRGLLKPYPTATFLDVAAEFPDAWEALAESGELELPITADHLPGISGRQVTSVAALYGDGSGPARFRLNGDARLALEAGRPVSTPGLAAGPQPWRLTLDGDPADLTGLSLVILYRAIP